MNNNDNNDTQFLMYIASGGQIRVETRLQDETLWLSINQMAELFDVDKSGIKDVVLYADRKIDATKEVVGGSDEFED